MHIEPASYTGSVGLALSLPHNEHTTNCEDIVVLGPLRRVSAPTRLLIGATFEARIDDKEIARGSYVHS